MSLRSTQAEAAHGLVRLAVRVRVRHPVRFQGAGCAGGAEPRQGGAGGPITLGFGCLVLIFRTGPAKLPKGLTWPMIFAVSVCGTYSLSQSMLDVWIMLFFGVIGFFMRRYGFSVVPVIIGLILGELVEGTLRQSLVIFEGNWFMFLTRPIVVIFFILSLIALVFPLLRKKKKHD